MGTTRCDAGYSCTGNGAAAMCTHCGAYGEACCGTGPMANRTCGANLECVTSGNGQVCAMLPP